MPFYRDLRSEAVPVHVRRRASEGLLRLKQQFADERIPPKNISDTLLLATWNLREFDSPKYGARSAESYHYIAEIIDHFDLVAIQEVRADLAALKRLQSLLGGWWKYVVTDVTLGKSGNEERLAFLFDTRKVVFNGLAGELVLPNKGKDSAVQFARTPFICGFKAGWTEFMICTVHIYYGQAKAEDERRVQEIKELAGTLAAMARGGKRKIKSNVGDTPAERDQRGGNLIVLGDFNIFSRDDATYRALTGENFAIPPALNPIDSGGKLELGGSNLNRGKHYDQIAYMARPDRFEFTDAAGIFDFQHSVFGKDKFDDYGDLIDPKYLKDKDAAPADRNRVYNDWRTYQMSDHLLMWAELKIDFAAKFLERTKAWTPGQPV